ncbi:unnamed protein product [Linum tenue]|uniref:Uncharacterized protein n=1 Tax=Linum tenue TaxID=586396 RepID=A0AAV0NAY5_9ROSI|nr:unnamed protein product [Linum tenue]
MLLAVSLPQFGDQIIFWIWMLWDGFVQGDSPFGGHETNCIVSLRRRKETEEKEEPNICVAG